MINEVLGRLAEIGEETFGYSQEEIKKAGQAGIDLSTAQGKRSFALLNQATQTSVVPNPTEQVNDRLKAVTGKVQQPTEGKGIKDLTNEKTASY